MALVFLHHVVGDLTVGKPDLAEFSEEETVEAAIRAIGDCAEGAIAVWRRRAPQQQQARLQPAAEPRAARFVGMLNSLDVVAFLARSVGDHEKAMRSPVSEVVIPNPSLLKEVDPGTRLIDALEMMKQGVRRLLVRKSVAWKGISKRFSVLYNGKWLKNIETSSPGGASSSGPPSPSSLPDDKFCLLSREDVVRFLIGCLGALAPLPLSSISSLGAITPHYAHIEASSPALEAIRKIPQDPCAIAVVETNSDGTHKIVGDISAYKLWKCDYLAAAWAMANLSAGQFVIGGDDNATTPISLPDFIINSPVEDGGTSSRPRKFSSRSIGFFSNQASQKAVGRVRSMYRGRSAPLTCKHTSSLAAVMAQMLSHRATHVWVTDAESEDILVGVVSYSDILHAVTKNPTNVVPPAP
ncbi:CBS domain-containing protein CBSX6-like [Phoenix dactylifera]|uniref:CBS domain-containing protein CBSX6-like n=1 Tax=Phoenix dactylifera TaxID=42345 RepID=A0A8B7CM91_PHODC|nr:CBS domain-containing protein CBSX6-like [Phoenix dactylifera]